MADSTITGRNSNSDYLDFQRNTLRRQGRLQWINWVIVGVSILIALFAWFSSQAEIDRRSERRFERESERIVNLIHTRLNRYEDALLSGVAAIQIKSNNITRATWQRYVRLVNIAERYPGLLGMGVIEYVEHDDLKYYINRNRLARPDFNIHPKLDQEFHLPISFLEPEVDNLDAIGLDISFESNRLETAMQARRDGKTTISGPITLVQEENETTGFIFLSPFYEFIGKDIEDYDNDSRIRLFGGFVYSPVIIHDLVNGALGRKHDEFHIRILDGDTVIFDETNESTKVSTVVPFERTDKLFGRTWHYEIYPTQQFMTDTGTQIPIVVVRSGIALAIMLAVLILLFTMMNRSNRNVVMLAEKMTGRLQSQAEDLSKKNLDLESFARVVSHDLKTPIRNIQGITEFLEEDLSDYLASNDDNNDVRFYLEGLRSQATRSESLISGVLQYSMVGKSEEPKTMVNLIDIMKQIEDDLQLEPERLFMDGDLPEFETQKTRLEQVLVNLIGNAFKYNPDKETATVHVSVDEHHGAYHFHIRDNGPGIEQKYHERIFQPFKTLQHETDITSSGVGLSIVKRSVNLQGGTIWLDSKVDVGTTFHFSWPMADGMYDDSQRKRYA